MPLPLLHTQGIILKAANFQDFDKIITVYSADLGLVKFIVKNANAKQYPSHLTAPLTAAEFIFSKGKSDLLKCHEISLISSNHQLRENFDQLEAACDMLQVLLESQQDHTPSPNLYALFNFLLKKIPLMEHPYTLALSFRLKLLRHDGYLGINQVCSRCLTELPVQCIDEGQSYCSKHASPNAFAFDEEESASLLILSYCQNHLQLEPIVITEAFKKKVKELFISLVC